MHFGAVTLNFVCLSQDKKPANKLRKVAKVYDSHMHATSEFTSKQRLLFVLCKILFSRKPLKRKMKIKSETQAFNSSMLASKRLLVNIQKGQDFI